MRIGSGLVHDTKLQGCNCKLSGYVSAAVELICSLVISSCYSTTNTIQSYYSRAKQQVLKRWRVVKGTLYNHVKLKLFVSFYYRCPLLGNSAELGDKKRRDLFDLKPG